MPFQPNTYGFVTLYSSPKGEPVFEDHAIDLFWTSKADPKTLTPRRIEIVGCEDDVFMPPWSLQPKLAYRWKARCTGSGPQDLYKVRLSFNGKVLADGLGSPKTKASAYNLVHAFLNNETLRFEIETDCGVRAALFLKLNYQTKRAASSSNPPSGQSSAGRGASGR